MDLGSVASSVVVGLVIGGISGGLTAWVAFRIKFERFVAMDEQREHDWYGWRGIVDKRLDAHAAALAPLASHDGRIDRIERKVFNGAGK